MERVRLINLSTELHRACAILKHVGRGVRLDSNRRSRRQREILVIASGSGNAAPSARTSSMFGIQISDHCG